MGPHGSARGALPTHPALWSSCSLQAASARLPASSTRARTRTFAHLAHLLLSKISAFSAPPLSASSSSHQSSPPSAIPLPRLQQLGIAHLRSQSAEEILGGGPQLVAAVNNAFPHWSSGYDLDGRPVVYIEGCNYDGRFVFEVLPPETIVRYHVWRTEKALEAYYAKRAAGGEVRKSPRALPTPPNSCLPPSLASVAAARRPTGG